MMAVRAESISGSSFSEKTGAFLALNPLQMSELVGKEGFFMKLDPGSAGWCPPGYIHYCTLLCDSVWMKWSSMSAEVKPESHELRKVLSSCTLVVSSFPTLAVHYREWLLFLESAARPSK